ncbi:uncharacterized protein [Amphiura filiformis]|uniref:uncharacterized protein n=1 Tax=Amphiura filiformis TaxID=82378 RepID=UPI003B224E96
MCPDKDSVGACYESLHEASDLIQSEIFYRSPGTNLRVNYIGHKSLKTSKNLEDVLTYSKDRLMQAEKEDDGFVARLRNPEDVTTEILFPGYDKMFLHTFGSECRYEWLPMGAVRRCFQQLDEVNEEWEEDYRAVGKALAIKTKEVDQIVENSKKHEESPTNNIIKTWCRKNKRKMTIGMLQKLLSSLSLVANEDALVAVDEVIQTYEAKLPDEGSRNEVFIPGISEYTMGFRIALKRQWSALKAGMDPGMLVSRLTFLPADMLATIRDSSNQRRIDNVEILLQILLHCEEETCLRTFIDALRGEQKHLHLARVLNEDYGHVASGNTTESDSPSDGAPGHQETKEDVVHVVAESEDGDKTDDSEKPTENKEEDKEQDVEHNRPTADRKEEDNEGIPGKHGRHVMISYQWGAQKRMITLKDKLQHEGFQVWLDIQNIEAEYAYKRNVPIIPLKIDDFTPDGWLGAICGSNMYYHVGTDEMLNTSWSGLLRDINARVSELRTKHKTETKKGVSDKILRWRIVLMRKWTELTADMDPKMLVSRLTFIPPYVRAKIDESSDHQRMENVETLLQLLLCCEEEVWPNVFITALQGETKHVHLANALTEFENVAREIKTQADSPSDETSGYKESTEHSTKESLYPATDDCSDDKDDDGAAYTQSTGLCAVLDAIKLKFVKQSQMWNSIKCLRDIKQDDVYLVSSLDALCQILDGLNKLYHTRSSFAEAMLGIIENIMLIEVIHDTAADYMF